MKSILYEGYRGPRLPKQVQLQRVKRVIDEELTDMLETAGLQVDARYDEYSDKEPTQSSQRVVYVCSKRASGEKK